MMSEPAPDPLIDEVRKIRRDLSERFCNDVDKLCDHLQSVERSVAGRLVRRPAGTPAPVDRE